MAGRKKQSVSKLKESGKKHLTKEEIEKRESEEEILKKIPNDKIRPPTWLKKVGKKVFKDIVDNLREIDILCNLDIYTIAILSNCIDQYIQLNDSMTDKTDKNKYNMDNSNKIDPRCNLQLKLSKEIKSLGSEIGLSPNARLKLISSNEKEEDDEFENDF